MTLILASTSKTRQTLLANAGLTVEAINSHVDETSIKVAMGHETPQAVCEALASAKALAVSRRNPGAVVIGADQVLAFRNRIFDKPRDMAEARSHLETLRGHAHNLISAVACASNHEIIWAFAGIATLHLRSFSEEFLQDYLASEGQGLLSSVGGYKLEGRGIQLFERIEGDYFTILGLPMLPLLSFLRAQKAVPQ
ncbi:Maf family protein [Aestuariivirga sp.]|uniref:Maf family protein n=1 Tax=Aestuariivirga sp. TaxID=2650926 RepID=UPI0039E232FD